MDFNNDGMLDLLVGDSDGYVNYFRRTGSGIHDLASEGYICANGSTPIDVGNRSAPFFTDWNEDGLFDLVIGREATAGGSLWLYLNSGSPGNPVFTTHSTIKVAGSNIAIEYTVPHVIDMDMDGKKDIVIGAQDGHIYYCENTGTNASPAFSSSVMLEAEGSPISFPQYFGNLNPYVVDWNSDGWLDIIIGSRSGWVFLFISYPLTSVEESCSSQVDAAFTVAASPCYGNFAFNLDLPEQCEVQIALYSIDGRLVETLDFGEQSAGQSSLYASANGYLAGTYMLVAKLGDQDVITDKLVLLP